MAEQADVPGPLHRLARNPAGPTARFWQADTRSGNSPQQSTHPSLSEGPNMASVMHRTLLGTSPVEHALRVLLSLQGAFLLLPPAIDVKCRRRPLESSAASSPWLGGLVPIAASGPRRSLTILPPSPDLCAVSCGICMLCACCCSALPALLSLLLPASRGLCFFRRRHQAGVCAYTCPQVRILKTFQL